VGDGFTEGAVGIPASLVFTIHLDAFAVAGFSIVIPAWSAATSVAALEGKLGTDLAALRNG